MITEGISLHLKTPCSPIEPDFVNLVYLGAGSSLHTFGLAPVQERFNPRGFSPRSNQKRSSLADRINCGGATGMLSDNPGYEDVNILEHQWRE
jgi:hypothetical protein